MNTSFKTRINNDLKESQINWKIIVAFIPIAFFTYLFHEFGHWLFGELSGNDMTLSLNNSSPLSGQFNSESDALWSAIGGPAFTILQGLIFLFVIWKTKSSFAYSIAFFAVFSRFYSIVFGGINLQDEARIASMLGINKFIVAAVVLSVLFFILWKCNRIMKFNLKALGYYVVLGVFAVLIVIGTNELIMLS